MTGRGDGASAGAMGAPGVPAHAGGMDGVDARGMDARTAGDQGHRTVAPIVALDVPSLADARRLVEALGPLCDFYKVGLELFTADGPRAVEWLRDRGKQVFVDLKLHDIPNTVRSAARAVAKSGASLLTVHGSGGATMIRAAVEGAGEGSTDLPCAVLAVTVLTSLDREALGQAWGRSVTVEDEVLRLTGIALSAGARGVVCSGLELAAVKAAHGDEVYTLVPGVRRATDRADDQVRTVTPGLAARGGADWIILGRTVTAAPDVADAMRAVWGELGSDRPGS